MKICKNSGKKIPLGWSPCKVKDADLMKKVERYLDDNPNVLKEGNSCTGIYKSKEKPQTTITLYLTTYTINVQGKTHKEWVDGFFKDFIASEEVNSEPTASSALVAREENRLTDTEMQDLSGIDLTTNSTKDSEVSDKPRVFLSYKWEGENQKKVKKLKSDLEKAGYECWMDIDEIGGGDELYTELARGISNAKVLICCMTENYSQSENCKKEVTLAHNRGIKIIPLKMEPMTFPPTDSSMEIILAQLLYIKFFHKTGEESDSRTYWPQEMFEELLQQLEKFTG